VQPGALDVVRALVDRGVVVSIGHTDGDAGAFAAARAAGARYVTHLFNAMRPFTHRDPGPIELDAFKSSAEQLADAALAAARDL